MRAPDLVAVIEIVLVICSFTGDENGHKRAFPPTEDFHYLTLRVRYPDGSAAVGLALGLAVGLALGLALGLGLAVGLGLGDALGVGLVFGTVITMVVGVLKPT